MIMWIGIGLTIAAVASAVSGQPDVAQGFGLLALGSCALACFRGQ
jgi:hypothetical protein